MGIPSYYKKLVSSVNGLISKSTPSEEISWLWMDFNCLIYHCLQCDNLREYPGESEKEEWEKELIECIVKYTQKVINKVGATQGVSICIDGVVPMAKMRQQRLRRFKSAWMTARGISKDSGESIKENKESWDTNAITPGTHFMDKLKIRLERLTNKKICLSAADKPGEGEHKIMMDWRTSNYNGNFAIYGLDADLLVLTLLNREIYNLNNTIYLFREEINSGKIERDSLGEEEFEWFSVNVLRDYICSSILDKEKHSKYIINYCFAMSILGNDFLPSSLGLKIRDDGHNELLQILKKLQDKNILLINSDLSICKDGLYNLFTMLSVNESERISHYIYKKNMQAKNIGLVDDNSIEVNIGDNNWPLSHIEESCLRGHKKELCNNWEMKYKSWFSGFEFESTDKLCRDYLYTIQWTWAYYTGDMKNVCYNWYYPHRLPPLWKWLRDYISNSMYNILDFPKMVHVQAKDISPFEQLCIVLPLDSWNLIPDCKYKILPQLVPQYFPEDFTFDSLGKRFFWECEAEIPLISICEIKALFT